MHNEDRGKLDPPGHHGVFLGYCEHTDGIYVWDKESPGEPVRISRNYLGKSFHEACAVQSEPVGVSADNFEILQDEIKQLENNSYLDDTSQALPFVPPDNVPTETLLHWRNLQKFAQDRRSKYAQAYDLTPEQAEERVKQEWKLRELRRLESAKHARTLEQRLKETKEASDAVKAAGTQSSGGVTPKVSTPSLKRATLEGEPARKRRRTERQHSQAVSEMPAETDDDNNILSQSATQPMEPLPTESGEPVLRRQSQQPTTSASAGGPAVGANKSRKTRVSQREQPARSAKRQISTDE